MGLDYLEVGTPTHTGVLGREDGTYGPIPATSCWGCCRLIEQLFRGFIAWG